MSQPFPIVIVGGNNPVAPFLMHRLHADGLVADVLSRRPVPVPEGFTFTQLDLTQARNWIAPENAIVISLMPLWVLAQFLPRFIGVHAIIAVGSTNRFGNPDNTEARRASAEHLTLSEDIIMDWSQRSNVHYTLLRAPLVYDCRTDHNITRIAHMIRRFHIMPLATPANGLRQPIHADDAAKAVMACIGNNSARNKAFNIAGGETLTYRAMVERIFIALHKTPRVVMLPTTWLERAFDKASSIGLLEENAFSTTIFYRMNHDLVFETQEGLELLNYQPRGFHPEFTDF